MRIVGGMPRGVLLRLATGPEGLESPLEHRNEEAAYPQTVAPATSEMSIRTLAATLLGVTTTLAAGTMAPAQAQYYGSSNGWRQPLQSGPMIRPSHTGGAYQLNYPVMLQNNFNSPRRLPSQQSFGHSSGSYFGW